MGRVLRRSWDGKVFGGTHLGWEGAFGGGGSAGNDVGGMGADELATLVLAHATASSGSAFPRLFPFFGSSGSLQRRLQASYASSPSTLDAIATSPPARARGSTFRLIIALLKCSDNVTSALHFAPDDPGSLKLELGRHTRHDAHLSNRTLDGSSSRNIDHERRRRTQQRRRQPRRQSSRRAPWRPNLARLQPLERRRAVCRSFGGEDAGFGVVW